MRINPILKKEITVTSRSMRMSWELFAYEAVLALIFMMVMATVAGIRKYSYGNSYSDLISLFPIISIVQICIVALIIPIFTASAISGEKERQTFDIMMTTSITPMAIILGKLFSAISKIMLFVFASIPIMAMAFILGGLKWWYLIEFVILTLVFSILSGSVGILCSAICKKTLTSIILSYIIYSIIYGATFVPVLIASLSYAYNNNGNMGEWGLILLFNPVIMYEEFYMKCMVSESLMSEADFGVITQWLGNGPGWIILSIICILLLSFVFILFSCKMIDPLRMGKKSKKSMQKSMAQNAANSAAAPVGAYAGNQMGNMPNGQMNQAMGNMPNGPMGPGNGPMGPGNGPMGPGVGNAPNSQYSGGGAFKSE